MTNAEQAGQPARPNNPPTPSKRRKSGLLRLVLILLVFCLVFVGVGVGYVYNMASQSLPKLRGELPTQGIKKDVQIERDARGIVTVKAKNKPDLAFGLGYAHGQDRFFQMDLLRRSSSGELAELVGDAVVDRDKSVRMHRFRTLAKKVIEQANPEEKQAAEAYAKGVNAGLASLKSKPYEYALLGIEPSPWTVEDEVLCVYAMFLDLQGHDYVDESARGLAHDIFSKPVNDFLNPLGTEWDAPLDDGMFPTPAIPGPDQLKLGSGAKKVAKAGKNWIPPAWADIGDEFAVGSNNWAVAGSHTTHGGAILADDMHLGIRVPNIWYRASLVLEKESGEVDRCTGVTLPGGPVVVVGCNSHVAWGFTNAEGDWNDLVVLEMDEKDPNVYKTPDGPKKFDTYQEIIKVKGKPDVTHEVKWTIWGPLLDKDHRGKKRAWKWLAHDPVAVNFKISELLEAKTLEQALEIAHRAGPPNQNFVCADDKGQIAWTIIGKIPKRTGFDGRTPVSWADGKNKWVGYLDPKDYPQVVNPKSGRIWTANARVVSGEMLDKVGFGGYDLGARQKQIRDWLLEHDKVSEDDMLTLQLDDRAIFLTRWQKLLVETLKQYTSPRESSRQEMLALAEKWGARASVDSVGYRIVNDFRTEVAKRVLTPIYKPLKQADDRFSFHDIKFFEGPLWQLVSKQPSHLLNPEFETWQDLLTASADAVEMNAINTTGQLAAYSWGQFNTTKIQHPLSMAVPSLSSILDMPARSLPGGSAHMPRIQRPNSGASERLAVSPGKEDKGYLHMPGGQSGHFLSPHYRDMHDDWCYGRKAPWLPGPAVNTIVLKPAG